ncbi:MAG TPA: D-alanine--D-alanine ligase [Acetobacteraceae bacterium]
MKLDVALRLAQSARPPVNPTSFFEFWPGWLFYAPVIAHCVALAIRYRSPLGLTAANPLIAAGGLCGESKISILDQVGDDVRPLLARYTSLTTHAWDVRADLAEAEQELATAGLDYPVVAKPDIGCNGSGVRLIANPAALYRYLAAFPRGERLLLQEYLADEGEAGIFYIRHPDEPAGRITSITLKYAPCVTGDGRSSLRQLIAADPRAGRLPHLYLPRLQHRLHEVPPQGERVRLVFVGNHCKGSIFRDGSSHATPELTACFEQIARSMPEFHFGRIDVRFASLAALSQGEGFRIIEINGAGSEATHVWDPATRLTDAWRAQFFHYGHAYAIGAANRARGYRPPRIRETFRLWRRQKRLMARYPLND